jgi:hypothetical protein
MTKIETAWKLINIYYCRAPNGTDGRIQDRMELELLSEGQIYHVQVAASHEMGVNQLLNALRAAIAMLMRGARVGLPDGVREAKPGEVERSMN